MGLVRLVTSLYIVNGPTVSYIKEAMQVHAFTKPPWYNFSVGHHVHGKQHLIYEDT